MKKYVKPELFYEQFELSKHIADCAWELTLAKGDCAATPDPEKIPLDGNLFTNALQSCTVTEDNYQEFCYQDGIQGANVFAS